MAEKRDYGALLVDFQPRPIHSKRTLAQAYASIDTLMSKSELTRAEVDLLEMFSMLVEQYESIKNPTPDVSPAEMLAHLIETKGMTNAAVARETRIARSTVTEILSGKRGISKSNVSRLAKFFGVSPNVFLEN